MKSLETKPVIRKKLLQKRNSLTEKECKKFGIMIRDHLFSLNQYKEAEIILIYGSYQKEVPTYEMIESALTMGKKVYCPKVLAPGQMEFYEIRTGNDLSKGFKNIPEPQSMEKPFVYEADKKILMVMPMVGFDSNHNRMGYGGGFYDRYLQRYPRVKRIGLAFECQRYEKEIPVENTDVKPDYIITEKGIF